MAEVMPENEGDDEQGLTPNRAGGLQMEVVRSYLSFAWRAIRPRWLWTAGILTIGLALTFAALRYIPRTYSCTTVMMALENPGLDTYGGPSPFSGAGTLITRQENLEVLVRETGLAQKYAARRPAVLALKDRLIQRMFGAWDEKTLSAIVVGTLQSKINVGNDTAGNLAITVDWTDGKTAAELAEAARQGFLRTRHTAEVSAFEAKMSILDEHATKMRVEVETLADQINSAHAERAPKAVAGTQFAAAPAAASADAPAAPSRVNVVRRPSAVSAALTADLPEQRAKLADLKHRLTELENERERRLRDERAKLAELQLHLTPSHPQVITEQERIALLSQVPSEIALLRSEVADLEGTLKQREVLSSRTGSTGGASSGAQASAASVGLPTEIIQALENNDVDPALSAQISGAVARYGSLRDDIRAGRMQLDTAQAAFEHRYQIVVPAEVPNIPTKPKPPLIFGIGLGVSLLLGLLLPILAELKRGIIIERWQVTHMALPVLAELKLPPHSPE
jgi:uncharacterized protein involved in exopolysaccharide biosynthesis